MRKVFAVVLATLLFATTAGTASANVWEDNSGGGQSGGTGGGGFADFQCHEGRGYRVEGGVPVLVFEYYYPGCEGISSSTAFVRWHDMDTHYKCVVGWDVWRFYGTASNPTQFMSVSRINGNRVGGPQSGCMIDNDIAVFAPNPADRPGGTLSPYAVFAGNDRWDRPSYRIADTSRLVFTTGMPFNSRGSGSCLDLRAPQADVAAALDNQFVRQDLEILRDSLAARFGLQFANLRVNQFVPYYGNYCSSYVEYVRRHTEERPVIGACFAPIERRGLRFADYSNPSRVDMAWRPFGERYMSGTDYRGHWPHGPGFEGLEHAHGAIRNAIYDEVMTRQARELAPSGPNQVVVPGDPYRPDWQNDNRTTMSRPAAAAAARDGARCELDPVMRVFDNPPPPESVSVEPRGRVNVAVEAPSVFIQGGTDRRQMVQASPQPMSCSNCRTPAIPELGVPTGPRPVFGGMSISIAVDARGGYDAWREVARSADHGMQPRNVTMEFYAASEDPSQHMRFRFSGSGHFTAYPTVEFVRVLVGIEDGVPVYIWSPRWTPEQFPLDVRFSDSTITRTIVGATAQPR